MNSGRLTLNRRSCPRPGLPSRYRRSARPMTSGKVSAHLPGYLRGWDLSPPLATVRPSPRSCREQTVHVPYSGKPLLCYPGSLVRHSAQVSGLGAGGKHWQGWEWAALQGAWIWAGKLGFGGGVGPSPAGSHGWACTSRLAGWGCLHIQGHICGRRDNTVTPQPGPPVSYP